MLRPFLCVVPDSDCYQRLTTFQASEEVRKENEALKAKVAKLEYRILHLTRALESTLPAAQ